MPTKIVLMAVLLLPLTLSAQRGAQIGRQAPPVNTGQDSTNINIKAQRPPSELELLAAHVADLEKEVAALKQRPAGAAPVNLTPGDQRIKDEPKRDKADDYKGLQSSLDSLWKAIDQIWANLEKINSAR